MDLKYFDFYSCSWLDISGVPGASLEYDDTSGWITTTGKYKKYVAQISQSGTDDPTAIVLENTLGFTPDWKRDSIGIYGFDWDVDFDSTKCAIYISPLFQNKDIYFVYNDIYDITLYAGGSDGYISETTFEIRYYN